MKYDAHRKGATLAGLFVVPTFSTPYPNQNVAHIILGAVIGASVGGAMPDKIDPPTSPRHRSIGHGMVPAWAGLSYAWNRIAPEWERYWLDNAAEFERRMRCEQNPILRGIYWSVAQAFHCLVWACRGFVVGYGSHLLLDSITPAGLPILA